MKNLSILCRKTKTFIKFDNKYKFMLLEAFILSGIYKMIILIIPSKKMKRYFGTYNCESSENIENENYKIIRKVGCAVKCVSDFTPWESKCLVQALTAQRMLKRRKIFSTVYLGVTKEGDNKINAHAWLRSGRIFVTGGNNRYMFTQIAKFSNYGIKK